jgi:ribosome-binding factor A
MIKGSRASRVAESIRAELSELLLRGVVRDPRAAGATVTEVEVSKDMSIAQVRVRALAVDVPEAKQREMIGALVRARGVIRRELASRLGMRHTPNLKFHWDEGRDRAHRVAELLAEISVEEKKK